MLSLWGRKQTTKIYYHSASSEVEFSSFLNLQGFKIGAGLLKTSPW